MEISGRQEREKGAGELFETIMTENFLKLLSNTKLHPESSENTK